MFIPFKNTLTTKLIDNEVLRRAITGARTIAPKTDGRVRRVEKPAAAGAAAGR
jgi:hypothetical protein